MHPHPANSAHMLSFDIEEYFHVESASHALSISHWDRFESRIIPCVQRILDLLAEHGHTATFFVLGWVARRHSQLIRRIADAGHEIASHGMDHAMLHHLTPARFSEELVDSRRLLEDISGKPVIGFRAPTFSITLKTAWALDALAAAGYQYDSSIFPVRHDRYGIPAAPRWPHRAVGPGGGAVVEIPPLTLRLLGANLPIGGGGYLRLLPIHILSAALRSASKANLPAMIYMHPWELDPHQPDLPMSLLSRWRHRVNLHKTESKLRHLLERFPFQSVNNFLALGAAPALASYTYTR